MAEVSRAPSCSEQGCALAVVCRCLIMMASLLLRSMGSRHVGYSSCSTQAPVVVTHRLRCSPACGSVPDPGNKPSMAYIGRQILNPLRHHGSPRIRLNLDRQSIQLKGFGLFVSFILHFARVGLGRKLVNQFLS